MWGLRPGRREGRGRFEEPGSKAQQPTAEDAAKEPTSSPSSDSLAKKDAKDPKKKAKFEGTDCLAGKWHYDYADNALETMMANMNGAKLTKEEGEFVCEIKGVTKGATKGSMVCSTRGGKPVINEVTADQAGLPFKVYMEMRGTTKMEFTVLEDSKIQTTSMDASEFDLKVKATVAGSEIPFEGNKLVGAFQGETGAPMSFKCSADSLKLLQHLDDMETSWQTLTRVK